MTNPKTVTAFIDNCELMLNCESGKLTVETRKLLVELARHMVELKRSIDMTHPSFLSRHQEKVMESCQKTISKIEGE